MSDPKKPSSGDAPPVRAPLRTQIITPSTRNDKDTLVPALAITKGPRVGSLHRFKPGAEDTLTVGRTEDAQFVISDPTLSSVHAKFTWMPVGAEFHMLLEDLGSTNGTFVNGEKADATFLKQGDHILLGDVAMRFQMLNPQELAERDRLISKATEAEKDPLTKLANRRFMEDNLPQLLRGADLRGIPVSLMVLDLDFFKKVNDSFGHQVGDEVLVMASGLIAKMIRNSDVGVRFGGEEFVVFLPGSDVPGARLVAERIRRAIASYDHDSIAAGLKVTASIGVAVRRPGEHYEKVIGRADAALYKAKAEGRNRVIVSEGDEKASKENDPSKTARIVTQDSPS